MNDEKPAIGKSAGRLFSAKGKRKEPGAGASCNCGGTGVAGGPPVRGKKEEMKLEREEGLDLGQECEYYARYSRKLFNTLNRRVA